MPDKPNEGFSQNGPVYKDVESSVDGRHYLRISIDLEAVEDDDNGERKTVIEFINLMESVAGIMAHLNRNHGNFLSNELSIDEIIEQRMENFLRYLEDEVLSQVEYIEALRKIIELKMSNRIPERVKLTVHGEAALDYLQKRFHELQSQAESTLSQARSMTDGVYDRLEAILKGEFEG